MVKSIANESTASDVVTSVYRSITKAEKEKKASPELVSMLRTYILRMYDTSIAADAFFKKLKTELGTVLRANNITPPMDMKIISTTGMLFGPPPVKRQHAFRPEDLASSPEPALNIGILWKTKENGEKDGRTQLLYSEFLKVEVQPGTRNVKFYRVVTENEKTTLNVMSHTDEAANIMLSMSM